MKRKIFITLSLIVGLVLFINTVIKNTELFYLLKDLNYIYFLPFLVFSLSIQAIHAFRWKLILLSHNKNISFFRLLLYKFSGFAVSYFTPSAHIGGEPFRAWLLKKQGVKFDLSLSTVMIDKFLEIIMYLMFGFIGFIFLILEFTFDGKTFFLILATLILSIFGIVVFYIRMTRNQPFFSVLFRFSKRKHITKIRKGIENSEKMISIFFNRKRRILLVCFALTFINVILMFFEYHFILRIFGETATIAQLFMINSVVAISFIIPVPAGLGAMETGQAGLFSFLGFKSSQGLGLSLVVRAKDILISLVGIIYLAKRGIQELGISETKNQVKKKLSS